MDNWYCTQKENEQKSTRVGCILQMAFENFEFSCVLSNSILVVLRQAVT